MKLPRCLFALCLVAAIPACDRASDVPAMRQEAAAIAKRYSTQLTHLDERRRDLELRKEGIAGLQVEGAAAADAAFANASRRLQTLLQLAKQAPSRLETAKDRASVIGQSGDLRHELEEGHTLVQAALNAYEMFLTNAEATKNQVATASNPAGATAGTPPPPPPAPGSNSPPTPSGATPPSSSTSDPTQAAPAGTQR